MPELTTPSAIKQHPRSARHRSDVAVVVATMLGVGALWMFLPKTTGNHRALAATQVHRVATPTHLSHTTSPTPSPASTGTSTSTTDPGLTDPSPTSSPQQPSVQETGPVVGSGGVTAPSAPAVTSPSPRVAPTTAGAPASRPPPPPLPPRPVFLSATSGVGPLGPGGRPSPPPAITNDP
jgi:hypothetical protein